MKSAFNKILIMGSLLLLAVASATAQSLPLEPASKFLPDTIAGYKAAGAATVPKAEDAPVNLAGVVSTATRTYTSKDGKKFRVTVAPTESNSVAYALATNTRASSQKSGSLTLADVGTAGFQQGSRILFKQGSAVVRVQADGPGDGDMKPSIEFAKAFADTIDRGEADIPVLVKHLPNWESVQDSVLYATNKEGLKAISNQPILDALNFDGGAEAAIADYNGPKMVLVEFNTPQIASDNDQRVAAKLQELQSQGQPLPGAYRRVGNYAVFVFDAPSTEAANQLVDQVKYQQMVQWLGENPYRYDQAVREFADTTLGVFVNVVKASGLAILGSLALGGLLGAILFSRRRAQQRAVEAYSDAGGMLRLNLEERTTPNSRRLLGPGN